MQPAPVEQFELLVSAFVGSATDVVCKTCADPSCEKFVPADESRLRLRNFLHKWIGSDRAELHNDIMAMATEYDSRIRELLDTDGSSYGSANFMVAKAGNISRDENEAVRKLLAESRLIRELLKDAECGICSKHLTPYEVGCKGGHTLCKPCLELRCKRYHGHAEVTCPVCRERVIMEDTFEPKLCRHASRMFCDVVGHVCPLCTDPKERSLQDLLTHVKKECVSVVRLATRQDIRDVKCELVKKLTKGVIGPSLRALLKKRAKRYDQQVDAVSRWSAKRACATTDADTPPRKR